MGSAVIISMPIGLLLTTSIAGVRVCGRGTTNRWPQHRITAQCVASLVAGKRRKLNGLLSSAITYN
jgi:hypothetical protein